MSGDVESHTLMYLRRMDAKLDRLIEDVQDLKQRMTSVEGQIGALRVDLAGLSGRVDRLDTRMDRIERRLDPADA